RLGWLDSPARMQAEADDLRSWAATVDAAHVLLLGMGGSSLGSEVLRASFGDGRLQVLDPTDPATVAAAPLDDTFFVVSSKSRPPARVATRSPSSCPIASVHSASGSSS